MNRIVGYVGRMGMEGRGAAGPDWRLCQEDGETFSFTDGGETYVCVSTGRLCNAPELRQTLGLAAGEDRELMVRAYQRWGAQCLHRFNGEYALAILEVKAHRLFLARDRMGVKSLFFRYRPGELLFASEIGQLLELPGVEPVLDGQGVLELMMLGPGRIPGSGILRDIRCLEPGCRGILEEGRLEITRYWRLEDRVHRESFEDTAAHVRTLVTEALCCRLPGDKQVGACLSGGLDSSILSALCARELGSRPLQTFSVD